MRRWHARLWLGTLLGLLLAGSLPAHAQTFNSGSTGADGAFSPTSNVTLALPPDGVFNYTNINIPAGVTVKFTRNTANTPVTLLASGNVTLAGTIDVSGGAGSNGVSGTTVAPTGGTGGPGGFDGGQGGKGLVSSAGGAGLGPGGGGGGPNGSSSSGGAGFLTAGGNGTNGALGGVAYGTATLLPTLGGSGGGGSGATSGRTGPGGGGALVVAASGSITFSGSLLAKGGAPGNPIEAASGGAGSGGAVRLIATSMLGSGGSVNVTAGTPSGTGTGSVGRIRIEAYSNTAAINFNGVSPAAISIVNSPTSVALPSGPSLRITTVAGVAAPTTPSASLTTPDVTLPAGTANPVAVALAASNIPVGTSVTVTVTPQLGATSATSTTLSGTNAASTASASVTIPATQPCVIGATASFTLLALDPGGPVFVEGEEVERVRVTATLGGASQLAYVTRSGREWMLAVP